MDRRLIGAKDAAILLGVKTGTIYLWSAQRKDGLPSHKVGRCRRFDPEELMDWAKKAKVAR